MLSFFAGSLLDIRLRVIDYAGLSSDPNDIYEMLKYVK